MTGARVAASAVRLLACTPRLGIAGPSLRPFATASTPRFGGRYVPTPPTFDDDDAEPKSTKPTDLKNEGIRARFVRLVDPATKGLAGPFNRRHLLNKLDLDNFYLQQVTAASTSDDVVEWDEDDPPKDGFDVVQLKQFPICKIINKKEELQRQVARRAAKKAQKAEEAALGAENPHTSLKGTSKEVHISWTTTPHDLTHKLASMKTQLLKGSRINVLIAHKGRPRPYKPGKDPKRDHEHHRLIAQVDEFMCKKDALTPAQVNKAKGKEAIDLSAPLATSNITAADETVARRVGDVDWKYNRGSAFLTYELQSKG